MRYFEIAQKFRRIVIALDRMKPVGTGDGGEPMRLIQEIEASARYFEERANSSIEQVVRARLQQPMVTAAMRFQSEVVGMRLTGGVELDWMGKYANEILVRAIIEAEGVR